MFRFFPPSSIFLLMIFSQQVFAETKGKAETVFSDEATYQLYENTKAQISLGTKENLSLKDIQELFKKTIENPVARLDVIGRYDPSGAVGFCFGRAMAAQFVALQLGLKKQRILKLFVVGDLRTTADKGEWRFHVTTLVPGADGQYYAIDPISYGSTQGFMPYSAAQWVEYVTNGWDRWHGQAPRAIFYLTEAETVLPDITFLQIPERGDKLIELNFDPRSHGFVPAQEWKKALGINIKGTMNLFQATSAEIENKYFLAADEKAETRFNFEGLSVTDEREANGGIKKDTYNFSYNGYFGALMKTFQPSVEPFDHKTQRMSRSGLNFSSEKQNPLGSFRFPLSQQ